MSGHPRTAHRVIALTLVAVQLGGCATWSARPGDPREVIEQEGSRGVRVLRSSGDRLTVWNPDVVGDQVVGSTGSAPIIVPLADVREVEVRKISSFRTAILSGVLAGAVALAVAIVVYTEGVKGS